MQGTSQGAGERPMCLLFDVAGRSRASTAGHARDKGAEVGFERAEPVSNRSLVKKNQSNATITRSRITTKTATRTLIKRCFSSSLMACLIPREYPMLLMVQGARPLNVAYFSREIDQWRKLLAISLTLEAGGRSINRPNPTAENRPPPRSVTRCWVVVRAATVTSHSSRESGSTSIMGAAFPHRDFC